MKRTLQNHVSAVLASRGENESLARVLTAGFCLGLGVTTEELADIKTAVSEAVTNCVVHAYPNHPQGMIRLDLKAYSDGLLRVTIADRGCGIADVERARAPFFTTDREHERTGLGFSIMETFMTRLRVHSVPGRGTRVVLEKQLAALQAA